MVQSIFDIVIKACNDNFIENILVWCPSKCIEAYGNEVRNHQPALKLKI